MRCAFHLRIRQGMEKEYAERHRQVWANMLSELKKAGIRNYSIFADGNDLFGYWECDDINTTLAFLDRSQINADWQKYMSDVLETPSSKRLSDNLVEVFRLD